MARTTRQSKILDIIAKNEIETQEELVDALKRAYFNVTQATISRDIKELGLIKVMAESKKYKYALEKTVDTNINSKIVNMFRESVFNIDYSENIVVIKTLPGSANAAGMLVDKLGLDNVLGCVAGDDTIIIVARSASSSKQIVAVLNDIISN